MVLFVPLAQRELEAHVEEVTSRECVAATASTSTCRCRERYGGIRERFGESGELRCRIT
jgi:hypothetical protein